MDHVESCEHWFLEEFKLFYDFRKQQIEAVNIKNDKNELLDIDEHMVLRLLTKVLISKRSPNVEIKNSLSKRPGKVQREAIVDIVFFLHHKKGFFFCARSNNQKNFPRNFWSIRLAMVIWIASDNLI